jgi:membrane-associated phospholipid phosphatase
MTLFPGMGIAITGLLSGYLWKVPGIFEVDRSIQRRINLGRELAWGDPLWKILRLLGTSWVFLGYLAIYFVLDRGKAIPLILTGTFLVLAESLIKRFTKRARPFRVDSDVILRQRPEPRDASFPSGDATRIWFIFASLNFGFEIAMIWRLLALLLACFVSVGRIRLGVHYPTDVWSGSWFGFGLGLAWWGLVQG